MENKPHYLGHRNRLRSRYLKSKFGDVPDYEILEILLFSSIPRKDVKPLAKELLQHFGSLEKIIYSNAQEFKEFKEVGTATLVNFKLIRELIERIGQNKFQDKTIFNNWQEFINYCQTSMRGMQTEVVRIFYLDSANRLIYEERQDYGSISETVLFPREVAKIALEKNASSVIIAHNHPGGDISPSKADIEITKNIHQMLGILDIVLHDHIIISEGKYLSFREECLF